MYEQTARRLEKLVATFNQLCEDNKNLIHKLKTRDEPLVQKCRRLEDYVEGFEQQAAARERVLAQLEEKLKGYEDRESLPPPT